MGFQKPGGGGGSKFVGIHKGELALRCDEDDEDAVARELEGGPNAGDTIYEQRWGSFTGHLVDAYIKESGNPKYPDQLILCFKDKEDPKGKYSSPKIQMGVGSGDARCFYKKMANLELNNPITIAPYDLKDKETGKRKSGLTFYNGNLHKDNKVQDSYERDELPEWKKKPAKKDGKKIMVWDSEDELEVLLKDFRKFQKKHKLGDYKPKEDDDDDDEEEEEAPKKKSGPAKSKAKAMPKKKKKDDDDDDDDDEYVDVSGDDDDDDF